MICSIKNYAGYTTILDKIKKVIDINDGTPLFLGLFPTVTP